MRRLLCLTTLALASLLSACSILPKSEPLDVYLLPASTAEPAQPGAAPVAWSLRINTPLASQLLDSTRIAVIPEGDRISAYQGARWSDKGPLLLRNRLIDAFLADGRMPAVSSDDARLQADLEINTDLRAFQSDYLDGRPTAHILLDARLVNTASQRIVASRRFEVRQPAVDTSVPAVVRAFGLAGDQLSSQLLEWTWAQGQAQRQR
ncbi:ABC-type transport auxiliary lipoprotein family protein [Pseudomonas sp. GD03944]|uniref:ABC-type transport auxiliary lipoprotein family protein n=1 Tax=Pseudomonas sp. GD03944 TaxID=2975409 RepID=UPI00244CD314|nr:ABC-type transport auxiliary lipoprotein family protein [Pseudomonas sp. GD03944]MDH1264539.1 ABC-type transport auxiliary lipoprotein family protein [Pseudomonas sp. GD03944]